MSVLQKPPEDLDMVILAQFALAAKHLLGRNVDKSACDTVSHPFRQRLRANGHSPEACEQLLRKAYEQLRAH